MKYIIVIFTICSILGKDIYQASWDIWYVVNKEYVAQELCENQNIPMLNCNGKCYLSKQLKKAESALKDLEDNHKNNRPVMSENVKIAQNLDFKVYYEVIPEEKSKIVFQNTNDSREILFINSIDHPPQS